MTTVPSGRVGRIVGRHWVTTEHEMDTIKETRDEQAKGLHSLFNACMYRDECRTKEAELERLQNAIAELARYFTSGNSVPVERATILAKDFWRITGLTPNAGSNATFATLSRVDHNVVQHVEQ